MLKKLNDAMDYIEAHLEDEFLLEKISEWCGIKKVDSLFSRIS